MRGPNINPMIPNKEIPPNNPNNTITGCIFDFLPTSFILNIESM